ncbi:hypothetical protein B0H13DRAFT_2656668 [Mycena leptocephala]|nr:hypothetical protein B0H13DRAFT_2656668 [Mycena leptocephala]
MINSPQHSLVHHSEAVSTIVVADDGSTTIAEELRAGIMGCELRNCRDRIVIRIRVKQLFSGFGDGRVVVGGAENALHGLELLMVSRSETSLTPRSSSTDTSPSSVAHLPTLGASSPSPASPLCLSHRQCILRSSSRIDHYAARLGPPPSSPLPATSGPRSSSA